MDAGKLRHRIILQPRVNTKVKGELIETYPESRWIETWADIKPSRSSEAFVSRQELAEAETDIIIRFRKVNPQMRIKFCNRYFHIIGIINYEERDRFMILKCKEVL